MVHNRYRYSALLYLLRLSAGACNDCASSEFTKYQGFSLSKERIDSKPKVFIKNILFTVFFFFFTHVWLIVLLKSYF